MERGSPNFARNRWCDWFTVKDTSKGSKPMSVLGCRLANYGKFQEAAGTHLPSIGINRKLRMTSRIRSPISDRWATSNQRRIRDAQTCLLCTAMACLLFSLSMAATPPASADEGGRFVVLPVENPRYCGNELFRAFENYRSPRVRQLRERYGLDAVVANETDEWKRILLLRHWIASTIAIDNHNPTKTRGDAFAILEAALIGGKFHCAHFSIVQHAVLNSFGYVARRLGCGPGLKDDGGHHGVNEVWVNKFSKWVLIDAKYDVHFEKNEMPLSVLEIRDEVWRDAARSVVRVVGPDRRPMTPDPETGDWETRPDTYRWCSWETSTSRFTTFPAKPTSTLIMLQDDFFKNNRWYRDGQPHWAYDTPYMILTTRRDWIEWTPNVITSEVSIEDGKARVFLGSCTPNFGRFQMKGSGGVWSDCGEEMEFPLSTSIRNRFRFRTMNLFGVAGPEHRVEITHNEKKL